MTALSVGGAAIVGYLCGSFPTADLVARVATGGRVDLRNEGSGNPGATNAAQVLGTGWGIVVLLVDIAKGALAGVLGREVGGDLGAYLGATAAVLGHIAPVWSRFRGGKGVATSAGACLAVFPWYFPIDLAVAAVCARATRRGERAARISGFVWVVSAVVWHWRGWANGWGPAPSRALVGFSTLSAAMILAKFAWARGSGATDAGA